MKNFNFDDKLTKIPLEIKNSMTKIQIRRNPKD